MDGPLYRASMDPKLSQRFRRRVAFVFGLFAFTAAASLAPNTAQAKDMGGRFGVGVDTALGWAAAQNVDSTTPDFGFRLPGLALTMDVSSGFGLQVMGGVLMRNDDASNARTTAWTAAVRGLIRVEISEDVHLDGVLGFGLAGGRFNPEFGDTLRSRIFTIEVGLRPQYFVTENLSLHTQIGFAIAIFSDDDYSLGPGEDGALSIDIFGNANLLANAGFTYWL